jgi:hypothetical protein
VSDDLEPRRLEVELDLDVVVRESDPGVRDGLLPDSFEVRERRRGHGFVPDRRRDDVVNRLAAALEQSPRWRDRLSRTLSEQLDGSVEVLRLRPTARSLLHA